MLIEDGALCCLRSSLNHFSSKGNSVAACQSFLASSCSLPLGKLFWSRKVAINFFRYVGEGMDLPDSHLLIVFGSASTKVAKFDWGSERRSRSNFNILPKF